jgi:sugar lactone lactonase YvrE
MKTISAIAILSLFISSCGSENNDPAPQALELTLTGFSPTAGTEGTVVTLTGTNFSPTPANNVVKFNGVVTPVTSATTTSLTVAAPVGGTTGKITVEVGSELVTSTNNFTFNTTPASNLSITSFSPATGTTGTSVTIVGTNFSPVTADNIVKFNGTLAGVTQASATSLTVPVPAGATTGKITVQVGTALATTATDFTYVQATIGTVSTLAGNGTLGFAEGTGAVARFYQPTGLAFDADGNMYVADNQNHRIRKITPAGVVSTFAGSGTSGFADGTGTAAQFNSPFDVAVDVAGNVYVADTYNFRIRKITPAGVVTTLAGNSNYGYADGGGAAALFYIPKGLVVDPSGNVYVADENNQRIRKITPTGTVTTLAGSTSGSTDGDVSVAKFSNPGGIAIDADGNLYIGDTGNHRIRKITPAGVVSTLAGSTQGITDADGSAARFNKPTGVIVDDDGNIYVADDDNERIRKVTPSGTVTTIAGGFAPGFTDGVAEDATFRSPTGIALDDAGNIYVADRHNHSIRKIE